MNMRILMTAAAASAFLAGAAHAQEAHVISPTVQAAPGQPADPTNPAVSSTRATMPGANTTVDDTSRSGMDAKARLNGDMGASMAPMTPIAPMAPAVSSYSGDASSNSSVSVVASPMASSSVTMTTSTVTNGPVPDTAENRAKYGQPMSRAGKRTAATGN